MFLKQTIFKRLIKQAYKRQGLIIGNDGEEIFLEGGHWVIWLSIYEIPNKIKASIIELTGEIPDDGIVFQSKDKEYNQYEIERKDCWNIRESIAIADCKYNITKLIIEQKNTLAHILQDPDTKDICLINRDFIDLIDPDVMETHLGESTPQGPKYSKNSKTKIVYWENEYCILAACARTADKDDLNLIKHLETIKINKL